MTLTGLFVPLITPFDDAGAVLPGALRDLAHQVLDDGATGLLALGTTAEPGSLTAEERSTVLDVVAAVCRERSAPLLAGAATAADLQALGQRPEVTAALSVVPPFVRPGEEGVVAHFAALAAAAPVPLVVYHVPYRTGQSLSVPTIRRLAGLADVIGIKYAAGGIDADTVELMADPPEDFAVLAGDDVMVSPMLALGAQGAILASAHLATAEFAELIVAWRDGDATRARPLGHRLATLSGALFAEPNPTVIKAALQVRGRIPSAAVRLPLLAARPPAPGVIAPVPPSGRTDAGAGRSTESRPARMVTATPGTGSGQSVHGKG